MGTAFIYEGRNRSRDRAAVVLLAPALVPRRAWVLGSNGTENSLEDSGDLAHRIGRLRSRVTGYGNDSRQSRPSEQQTIAMNTEVGLMGQGLTQ
jgi:hypothetical protein